MQRSIRKRARPLLLGCLGITAVLVGFTSRANAPLEGSPPDESRFTKKVLVEGLAEPLQIEFDSHGRVYWIERSSGKVKRLDESTGQVSLLGTIPTTVVAEGGLIGILLDRDFETSRNIYFYYTYAAEGGEVRESRLSRITLGPDGRLDLSSEVIVLRIPVATTGHMGGGMEWDDRGNLYLTVGDNASATQYSTFRFTTPNGAGQDAQATAANTNDLRGKILRIHPERDGTYTIPAGNLFPPGTPKTRPEIYTMGNRNPWRPTIDSRTGYLHWGEIGPDAGRDSTGVGPMGYDEFNVARGPGNYGWPYFIGHNRAYHVFDYATEAYGAPSDSLRPRNVSPNNTGLRDLGRSVPPLIAYPYGVSGAYPEFSSGGRAAIGGPIFHRADFATEAPRTFPDYYEGKWFIVDYVRNWIFAVTMSPRSDRVVRVERFAPGLRFLTPIDVDFGPSGDLYLVEYSGGSSGKISKIEYNRGNRAPRVTIHPDRSAGAAPLRVALSSEGTVDPDGDALRFAWVVAPEAGGAAQRFTTANAAVTLPRPGAYRVTLTVRDAAGAAGTAEMRILAGNEPPGVTIDVTRGNRSFYFSNSSIDYRVTATDREDGPVKAADVRVTTEFIPSGLTPAQAEQVRALAPDASARNLQAFATIARSDCGACHREEMRMVGPSFAEVAARYRGQETAAERLAQKIIAGGSGVWGTTAMPPHPTLTPVEAATLARYVLSVGQPDAAPARVAMQGTFTTPAPATPASNNPARVVQRGSYLMRATYTDRGAPGAAPLTTTDVLLLRQPKIAPQDADVISEGTTYAPSEGDPGFVVNRSGAHIGFRAVDLTGVDSIAVGVLTRFYTWSHFIGGTVEVRLDSATGPLMGQPVRVIPPARRAAPTPPARQHQQGASNPSIPIVLGADLERPVVFPVGGLSGPHDVFVVFRNDNAKGADALFLVTGVEFRPAGTRASVPAGFTRIFNGADLTGWHVSRSTHQGTTPDVRVEDGAIVLRQQPYGQGGILLSDREYENFDLYLEAKTDFGTNGGVFLRSTESGSAYQIELVGDGLRGTGDLLSERLTLSQRATATDILNVWKVGEWNSIRIRMEGAIPHLTLWVNGVQMWDVTQPRNDFIAGATRGHIALQSHWTNTFTPIPDAGCCPANWKPGASHRFRNLAIRELP